MLALFFATALVWPRRLHVNRSDDGVICAGLAALSALYSASLLLQLLLRDHDGSRFAAVAPAGELGAGIAMLVVIKVPAERWLVSGGGLRALSVLTVFTSVAVLAAAVLPFHIRSGWGMGVLIAGLATNGSSASVLTTTTAITACGLIAWTAYRIRFRDGKTRGGVTAWLALGLALFALSALARVLPAGFLAGGIPLDNTLRLCGAAVMLVAVLRRESVLRLQAARRAALAERQRVARDLHDGIAQDLAFIASHGSGAGEIGEAMAVAARRALTLTRGVIDDLSDLQDASLPEGLSVLAEEMEDRFGVVIRVELDGLNAVDVDISNELLRIVREAITNAARHGEAENILVAVEQTEIDLVLRVRDDGRGIGVRNGPVKYGFGLTSMSERAASTGGRLTLSEVKSGGTELMVAWS
ncbi:MAG TPA: ATP-binding protein [Solirubrobacteraceae bacterium]|nr:ATP-binding protein [Solirubrobacteraceae bacterium]